MDWKLYAWLKRGKRRQGILKVINKSEKPLTKNKIRKKIRIAMSNASVILKELSKNGLIECLNPEDGLGKLFRITKIGRDLLNEI